MFQGYVRPLEFEWKRLAVEAWQGSSSGRGPICAPQARNFGRTTAAVIQSSLLAPVLHRLVPYMEKAAKILAWIAGGGELVPRMRKG